jgi:hypothetical protein
MSQQTLEGHVGAKVQIDVCSGCQVIWFDHFESLQLSPGGTLRLFQTIGSSSAPRGRRPLGEQLTCPRCEIRLVLTNDRQRNTPFRYWRCVRSHGKLITFFDFLREKDFIRPLSPAQLDQLRQNVQMINCSNCGAPIDLARASTCAHCGTAISTVDLEQISRMAKQLQRADSPRKEIDVAALFDAFKADLDRERHQDEHDGLVEAGLRMIAGWLSPI